MGGQAIATSSTLIAPPGHAAEPAKRRRRTRADVTDRIHTAARELFAERGYQGATTKEIARLADVSETLLFRYYGSKAALFDEVVAQPFNRLLLDFLAKRPHAADPQAAEHGIFMAVYDLIDQNRALFTALLSAKGATGEDGAGPPFNGLLPFYRAGAAELTQKYTELGQTPPFDLQIALRLAFGMLASSVLLRDWLFPDGVPPGEQIVGLLEQVVARALEPVPVEPR
ncbi:TetR/AcrR family transcriptional regulator [Novosphingobium cyanobacteriorum]|uniref:TetR/AcrR family transcriptional regulator n=1 Tax=Novosphingobium cyanobacteriorum TaxID=3024215 RepID=A0ABT6CNT4_9SPHN|nr:TetR/AcrR family transcriptional regulator [Novosphingobium cyanobacteriorum]MDF8334908.1 TetR/AcrR family transcriptional regulator [Novosphingobium cyanobacteriorum]